VVAVVQVLIQLLFMLVVVEVLVDTQSIFLLHQLRHTLILLAAVVTEEQQDLPLANLVVLGGQVLL
jgi:hypothetical protein